MRAIIDSLKEGLCREYPESKGRPRVLDLKVQRRTHCDVVVVTLDLDGKRKAYHVKVLKDPSLSARELSEKAQKEEGNLAFVRAHLRRARSAAPIPLPDHAREGCVVTEYIAGERFHDLIRRKGAVLASPAGLAGLIDYCRQCGVWLRDLHEQTSTGAGCLDRASFWARLERGIHHTAKIGIRRGPLQRARDAVQAVLDRAAGRPFPVVAEHNDFTAENIVISGGRAIILDYEALRRRGVPFTDIATFLVAIEGHLKYPLLYRKRQISQMENAFLNGYGECPYMDEPVLLIYKIKALFELFAYTFPRDPAQEISALKFFRFVLSRRHVHERLNHYVDRIER